jgi:hypothetical protein
MASADEAAEKAMAFVRAPAEAFVRAAAEKATAYSVAAAASAVLCAAAEEAAVACARPGSAVAAARAPTALARSAVASVRAVPSKTSAAVHLQGPARSVSFVPDPSPVAAVFAIRAAMRSVAREYAV